MESKGFKVETEHYVKTSGGSKGSRYGDLLVTSPEGEQLIIQVGRQTKTGAPISREIKAIQDLQRAGYQVEFVPYKISKGAYDGETN